MRRIGLALPLLLLALVAAGCGGDEESASDVTAPELTVPQDTETESTETQTTTAPSTEQAPPADTSGGSTVPSPETTPQDSPENDIPPPPGSPAERFEEECKKNPEACG